VPAVGFSPEQVLLLCACRCSNGSAALAELSEQQQIALLQCHFLFSLVWSIGANTDEEGRKTFDGLLRKLLSGDAPPQLAAYVKAPEVGSSAQIANGILLVLILHVYR
jgi:hypothetical protein